MDQDFSRWNRERIINLSYLILCQMLFNENISKFYYFMNRDFISPIKLLSSYKFLKY
jgi:hypothetical protein